MSQKISPFLEGKYGWDYGESGWNAGMDENLLKFSFLFNGNVEGIVSVLPSSPSNGSAYFLELDNRFYFYVSNTWQSCPVPKWFEFNITSTGDRYQFNGVSANKIDSASSIDSRIDTLEEDWQNLGSAAFQDVEFFATKANLDIASAQANAYTDELREDVNNRVRKTPFDYGAVGDGITDDTQAVISSINSGYSLLNGNFYCTPFEIINQTVDIHFYPNSSLIFDHQESNSITFTGCSGLIDGIQIYDSAETSPGIYITLFINSCSDLVINRPILNGGKDLPVAVYQSDNCHIIDGVGKGTDTNRPFGWELISCKASTFTRCRLYKYNFGFTLIGPGYKSGTILPSTRTWADTLGMKAVDCYVEDHTGHAFDMNGTVGGGFSGCTAKDYTGTAGNSSFQVKQSTNIAEELPDSSYFNSVENCAAINCVTGFSTQQGTDVQFRGLRVIRAKRYPVTFNSTKRVMLDGLMVTDWGLDLASWPLLNGDAICAGVAVWSNSDSCDVRNVVLTLTDNANPNIGTLALCNVLGNNCTVGAFRYYREAGVAGALSRAIRISGSNTLIEAGFRPGGAAFYTNHPVDDSTESTMYPLEFGMNVSLTSAGAFVMPSVPQRGMIPVKIFAKSTLAISGSPTYSVGFDGNNVGLLASRPAPSASETLSTTTTFVGAGLPLKVAVGAGTGGQLSVSVRGLHLL